MPIERAFVGWDAPALPRVAAVLCDRYASADAIRLDRALLVLPGARAGRRLKELLLAESEARRLPLVPPRVATVGALPELLYEIDRPVAAVAVRRLVWAAALRAAGHERTGSVFGRRPDAGALHEWAGLARELFRLHGDLASAGLDFGEVAGRCAGVALHDDRARWDALAGVQSIYRSRLSALRLLDPDAARLAALRDGALHADGDLWLVGVVEMPETVRRMLHAVAAAGCHVRALVHAPQGQEAGFDELGCLRPAAWLDARVPVDDAGVRLVDRPEHQAVEVVRALAALGARYAGDEVAVAVPDPEVVPYIEQRLADAGVAAHYAAGTSLSTTAPFRLLRAVADYLDGRRVDALAALARHPDVLSWLAHRPAAPGLSFDAAGAWLRHLDAFRADRLPDVVPSDGFRRAGPAGAWAGALVSALDDELLGGLRGVAPLSEWVQRALALLARCYESRKLDPAAARDRQLIGALRALGEAAAPLAALPAGLDEPGAAPAALRLLLEECAGTAVPQDADAAAVELLGWLEMHLDDAPVAIVTGVNEPFLPASVGADAFLPNHVRAALGLVDADRRYARDAYQLSALLSSRRLVTLIGGRRTATGDPLRPSRLLFAADGETVARRIRHFYDDAAGQAAVAGAPPEEAGDDATAAAPDRRPFQVTGDLTFAPPRRIRVTAFADFIADPYMWALTSLLRLEPIDDDARELDPLGFGTLAHRVLESFGRSPGVHATDAAATFDSLAAILDAEMRERFGDEVAVAVKVQAEQLRARLRGFARWHADRIANGWRVVAVECGPAGEGAPFVVDGEPIHLSGRVDRVDYHAGRDEWAVFDYKTGDKRADPAKAYNQKDGRWVDLQLPLYRLLLPLLVHADGTPVLTGDGEARVRLGYIVLPGDPDSCGEAVVEWDDATLESAYDAARQVVRELRAGVVRFDRDRRPAYPEPRVEALLGRGQLGAEEDDEALAEVDAT
jgi:ATP-dependent helicase/nuclease subunit B